MRLVLKNLEPYEFELINGDRLKVNVENCEIKPPKVNSQIDVVERRIFPAESRQRAVTYTGNCTMTLGWIHNGTRQGSIDFDLGPMPIMIRVSYL
jgi:DNA-directed RNA polymerase beta subunit